MCWKKGDIVDSLEKVCSGQRESKRPWSRSIVEAGRPGSQGWKEQRAMGGGEGRGIRRSGYHRDLINTCKNFRFYPEKKETKDAL